MSSSAATATTTMAQQRMPISNNLADIEDLLDNVRSKIKRSSGSGAAGRTNISTKTTNTRESNATPPPSSNSSSSSSLCFYVNGARYEYKTIDPEKTIIEFLREQNLTGTKLGCAEGGCGACTIVMTSFDTFSKKLVHRPINSCLTTIASAHGCAITTVEGLAEARGGHKKVLHPIQQSMADQHASQCGFCTPGIIMSMYAMWLTHGNTLTAHAVEEGLDGNLCRCTGYRPITDALHGLADALGGVGATKEAEGADHPHHNHHHHDPHSHDDHHRHDHDHDHGGACQGRNEITKICNRTGKPCAGTCHSNLKEMVPQMSIEWAGRLEEQQQTTFAKLPANGPGPLYLCGDHLGEEVEWFAPRSLAELCCVIRANQLLNKSVRLAMGNSERRVEKLFKRNHVYPLALVTPSNVIELRTYTMSEDHSAVTLGCAAPIHDLQVFLAEIADKFEASANPADRFKAMIPRAYVNQMKWFAGRQVRNAASLGGNLVTASPISDLNALHMAAGATLTIARFDETTGALITREQSVSEGFFTGYRQTSLLPHEVVVSITIPLCRPNEFFFAFKQCRRKEDDIAIVNAAFRTKLSGADYATVEECVAVFGGMGPTMKAAVKYASSTSSGVGAQQHANHNASNSSSAVENRSSAVGRRIDDMATVEAIATAVRDEMKLPANVPGGMGEYRTALAGSFALKNYFQIIEHIATTAAEGSAAVALGSGVVSATQLETYRKMLESGRFEDATHHTTNKYHSLPIHGLQHKHHVVPIDYKNNLPDYTKIKNMGGVGASAKHLTADSQVCGEAKYVDDAHPLPGEVYAALVTSSKARAKIVTVNTARAEREAHGYVAYYGHKDIPQDKVVGAIVYDDEELFASTDVHAVGQPIGIVIAKTPLGAREAAAMIGEDIVYSTEGVEPPCLSIDDAIARGRFYSMAPNMPTENRMTLTKYPGKGYADVPAPNFDTVFEDLSKRGDDFAIVEGESFIGGQEHFYFETQSARVWMAENGEMYVESSGQDPAKTQALVSQVTGLPRHKITSSVKRLGGGFGGKESRAAFFAAYASVAALNSGKPVRLVLDRDADMQCSGQRNAFKAFYKVAINKKTLKLEAVVVKSYCSAGWSADLSVAISERCVFHCDGAYVAPYVHIEQYVCRTNISSNTAFRGFGAPQGFFFAETYIEHAAKAVGVPVTAVKLANLYRVDDVTPYGVPEREDNLIVVADRIRETSEYAKRVADVAAFNATSRYRKRGLHLTPVKYGMSFTKLFMYQGTALVHLYQDGTVMVTHGATEMGQGVHTKVAQIVATAFNIPLSAVHIGATSTDKVANTQPTSGSVGSDLSGAAAQIASDTIMERIKPYIEAATEEFLKANPQYTSMTDVTPQDHVTVLGKAAVAAHFNRVKLSSLSLYRAPAQSWDWPTRTGAPFFYSSFGCAVAEVEVDTLTGDHTTLRVDALHDTGASLNPACDIGQIEGAFVQGMGLYTIEELVRMPNNGALFTKGPGTYKIPAFSDMPKDFRVEVLNKPTNADTVHKSKGVGEPPLLLGYSVAGAVKDAIYANREQFAAMIGDMPNVKPSIKHLIMSYAKRFFRLDSPFTVERIRTAMWDEVTAPMASIRGDDEAAVRAWLEASLAIVPMWNPQV